LGTTHGGYTGAASVVTTAGRTFNVDIARRKNRLPPPRRRGAVGAPTAFEANPKRRIDDGAILLGEQRRGQGRPEAERTRGKRQL
jgi:hypothetical protein